MKFSIQVQLNIQSRKLNFWKKAVEKAINIEVKRLLQLPSNICKINIKYFLRYKPIKKEKKDFGKNKSVDTPLANAPSEKHPQ